MASVNKVILIGNLGAKPELKTIGSGQEVCELRIATSDKWTDKQGQKQERTEWHRVVVWGKSAANCAKYLDKGKSAYVEGRLQTRSWDDKDGNKRYMTEIVADRVQFLSGGGGGSSEHGASPPASEPSGGYRDAPPPSGGDDDIPF